MNRTTATILTVVTSLLCGLPGLISCCFGLLLAVMVNDPTFRSSFEAQSEGVSPDAVLPMGIGLICLALVLIAIPALVGFFSFRMSRPSEPSTTINYNEPFPPAS